MRLYQSLKHPCDALAHYINAKCALIDERSLQGMKIVVDTANGSIRAAPKFLSVWG